MKSMPPFKRRTTTSWLERKSSKQAGKPPDRVKYTSLAPAQADFDEIMNLAVEIGVLERPIAFEEYADTSFSRGAEDLETDVLDEVPWTTGTGSSN